MIVLTGARGFIGSNLLKKLNDEGLNEVIIVDEFEKESKKDNLVNLFYKDAIHRNDFIDWFKNNGTNVSFVFHLGARTDTTETDTALLNELNLDFTKEIWNICTQHNIPLLYASSAATYGDGTLGFNDESSIDELSPLNAYGWSKHNFDLWTKEQQNTPPFWAGLKFFNVYGPHEDHKGRMASVVYHAYHQIKETKAMKLFASHNPNYKNGEQLRDFIYVDDVIDICYYIYLHQEVRGIFNVGTGEARSFNDLVKAVFKALDLPEDISYIPTPIDIREKYQYFTEASTEKIQKYGYPFPLTKLEDGVAVYIDYLEGN